MRGISLVILIGLGVSLGWHLSDTPAFSEHRRVDTAYGWAVAYPPAHFDPPRYLSEASDEIFNDAVARDETALRRVEAWLQDSLSMAPADAYTWTSLAWILSAADKQVQAQQALSRSWSLAPHNQFLAVDRILLAAALYPAATEAITGPVEADFSVIERFDPAAMERLHMLGAEQAETQRPSSDFRGGDPGLQSGDDVK